MTVVENNLSEKNKNLCLHADKNRKYVSKCGIRKNSY